jgi:glycosyltransferase involved in cell wall biosynthesis
MGGMTVSIDCRMIDASGIGVYLRGCLPHLLATGYGFLLIGRRERLESFVAGAAGAANVRVLDCAVPPFSVRGTLLFPSRLLRQINRTDAFYSPHFSVPAGIRVPVYTTIHDIIFPDMPELCSRAGLAARMMFYRRAFARSSAVFTVSRFSASRIIHHLGSATPIVITYVAARDEYLQAAPSLVRKKNIILFVGNIKKHKGLSYLLEAFFAARNEGLDYSLVIVGEKDRFRSKDDDVLTRLAEEGLTEDGLHEETGGGSRARVIFTGFVTEERLKRLFDEAALLVQPSLYEGFGFPPLEALVRGTPALVSDIEVFREVYADFPVSFFRAGDSADLKRKLLTLLVGGPQSVTLPPELRERYTFAKTAAIIMKTLEGH